MLEIQVKIIPGATGMIFSQTPPGSSFPVGCVGGFRHSPTATGQLYLESLPGLKTNAGLKFLSQSTVEELSSLPQHNPLIMVSTGHTSSCKYEFQPATNPVDNFNLCEYSSSGIRADFIRWRAKPTDP